MALSRRTGARFQASIWPGFVDAMTGLLLVLMFLLTIFMVVQFVLRETISGQETELDALSVEVAALAKALGLEQDRSASLSSRVGELTVTLGDARARQEEQTSLIATLQAARIAQAQALSEARTRIASFEEQVTALLADRDKALGQISDLEGARDVLLTRQEALQLALAGLRDEVDAQTEAARLAAARRDALNALVADLQRQNAAGQEDQAALSTQVADLEAQLSDEEKNRLLEAAAAEALREKLENANAELTAMTLSLEEQRRKAEETLAMLAAAEAASEDLDIMLAAALLAGEETRLELDVTQGDVSDKDTEISLLQDQLAQIEADLVTVRSAQSASEVTAAESEALIADLNIQLASLRAELKATQDLLAEAVASSRLAQSVSEGAAAESAAVIADLNKKLALVNADLEAVQKLLAEALDETRTAQTTAQGSAAESASVIYSLNTELARVQAELKATQKSLAEAVASARAAQSLSKDAVAESVAVISDLKIRLARMQAKLTTTQDLLTEALASARSAQTASEGVAAESAAALAALTDKLTKMQAILKATQKKLAKAMAAQEVAETEALDADEVRKRLTAALAAKLAAQEQAGDNLTKAEERAILLAQARKQLAGQTELTTEAQKQQVVLNQQIAELRNQLLQLRALLDDSKTREVKSDVQLQSLGKDLNTALARVASEERRQRLLEEEKRKLEEEKRKLEEEKRKLLEVEKENLEKYRSEFFGRLRDVLGAQEGVQIVGDRFVFSSEVLFAPGKATLSESGRGEIAKVVGILNKVAKDIPDKINWIIRVDGHTDDVPLIGGAQFADNWELSQARALSVVRYMIDTLHMRPDRLSANGFGQYQPINRADTPEARAQNRRIELKFTEK